MTSSFGNLVGTERDEIPNISNTNYTNTEADLTESVNSQIDANINDTRVFYERLGEIQKTDCRDSYEKLGVFSTVFKISY